MGHLGAEFFKRDQEVLLLCAHGQSGLNIPLPDFYPPLSSPQFSNLVSGGLAGWKVQLGTGTQSGMLSLGSKRKHIFNKKNLPCTYYAYIYISIYIYVCVWPQSPAPVGSCIVNWRRRCSKKKKNTLESENFRQWESNTKWSWKKWPASSRGTPAPLFSFAMERRDLLGQCVHCSPGPLHDRASV